MAYKYLFQLTSSSSIKIEGVSMKTLPLLSYGSINQFIAPLLTKVPVYTELEDFDRLIFKKEQMLDELTVKLHHLLSSGASKDVVDGYIKQLDTVQYMVDRIKDALKYEVSPNKTTRLVTTEEVRGFLDSKKWDEADILAELTADSKYIWRTRCASSLTE